VVDHLDLLRYVGRWYEIARIPNRFQRDCASNTTADYRRLADDRIEVTNRCRTRDGKFLTARGVARIASGDNPARLEVSFVKILGQQLFWGDYWVIGLGENYEWAIVGHPQRKYGWILASKPRLDETTLRLIRAQLIDQGYDPNRFVTTPQSQDAEPGY
jgi:apolipoprotein D and lipocalin family protein